MSVELKRDTLGTWLEVGGWELVAGMDGLLGNRALPVAKIQKNGRSVGTHDGTTLTIEDTATGGLGTFVQGARLPSSIVDRSSSTAPRARETLLRTR